MNRDPILFRVDGTAAKGWERLARTMALAAALQRRRRPTYFLSQLEPTNMAFTMKRSGMEWLDADAPAGTPEDLSEVIQEVRRLRPAAVVLDAPEAGDDYLRSIEKAGAPVISIDHHAATKFPSRLVINPLLGPGRDGYSFEPGAQLLLGARYAIVRPEVRRARPARAQEQPAPIRALVALGDDDPHRQTLELTKQLLGMPKIERVDMIVRPQHPDLAALQEFTAAHEDRVTLASEGADITSRIARCHFGISSGAALSLELACVGVPQLLIVQNEAHWPTAQRLEEEGAATCLGWHENVSAQTIRLAVQNLVQDPCERQAMSRCGRQLIDGRGLDRLVTGLEVLLHPSRQVHFAKAA